MQNWDDYFANQETTNCLQSQDWSYAESVANQLGIEIHKVDFVKEYWDEVFKKFLEDSEKGLTPNPDILCNSVVKFNYFIDYVEKNFQTNLIATGHYAGIKKVDEKFFMTKAKDDNKDQTYFLCKIKREVLKKVKFPLQNLKKSEVREIAEKEKLINAKKKDSTGICFIGERKFEKFLSNYLSGKEGKIIDVDSREEIGSHSGIFFYTIGQRKGLNLAGKKNPYYVVAKNVEENIVYAGMKWDNNRLYSDECFVKEINWLVEEKELLKIISDNKKITAKFRYRQPEVEIEIDLFSDSKDEAKILFQKKERAITPGQYAVFYQEDVCLGGGVIHKTNKINEFCDLII